MSAHSLGTWSSWDSKVRRKSIKDTSASPRKRPAEGPVPPLPGKESNVFRGPEMVVEAPPVVEEVEAGGERGRLFVKVVGVKDLDLPLVKGTFDLEAFPYFC